MTDDTTNEQHLAQLACVLGDSGTNLTSYEIAAVRWARDQVVELRRELDETAVDGLRSIAQLRRERDKALRQWARLECQVERLRARLHAAQMRETGASEDDVQRYLEARNHGPDAARMAPMLELVAEECCVAAGADADLETAKRPSPNPHASSPAAMSDAELRGQLEDAANRNVEALAFIAGLRSGCRGPG